MAKSHKGEINKLRRELEKITDGYGESGSCARCGECYCWQHNASRGCVTGRCWQPMETRTIGSREAGRLNHEMHAVEVIASYCPMCGYDKDARTLTFDIDAASSKQPAEWRVDIDNWINHKKLEIRKSYEQQVALS
tara:strand:+ start:3655 stop:4062 length:408 start_codon:yes stop_codon:yes gene_type:complete